MADETFNPFGGNPVSGPSSGGVGTTSSPSPNGDFNPFGGNPIALPEPQRPQSTTPETDSAFREVVTDTTPRYPPVTAWQKNLARIKAAASAVGGALGPPAGFDVGGWLAGRVTPEQKAAAEIPSPAASPETAPTVTPTESERATLQYPQGSPEYQAIQRARAGNLLAPPGLFARQPTVTETIDYLTAPRPTAEVPLRPPNETGEPETGGEALSTGGLLGYAFYPRKVSDLASSVASSLGYTYGPSPGAGRVQRYVEAAIHTPVAFADFMTTPEGAAWAAAASTGVLAATAITAGFTVQQAAALEQAQTPEEKTQAAIGLAASVLGLRHIARGIEGRAPVAPEPQFTFGTQFRPGVPPVPPGAPGAVPVAPIPPPPVAPEAAIQAAPPRTVVTETARVAPGAPPVAREIPGAPAASAPAAAPEAVPAVSPEVAEPAALVTPDGKVWRGRTHIEALDKLEASYPKEQITAWDAEYGKDQWFKAVGTGDVKLPVPKESPYFVEKHGNVFAVVDRRKPGDVGLITNNLEQAQARKAELDTGLTGGGEPSATTIESAGPIPKLEVRPPVGEETPLRGEPERLAGAGKEPVPAAKPVAAAPPEKPYAPVAPAARSEAIYQEAVRRVDQRLGLPSDRRLRSDDLQYRGMTNKDLQGLYDQEYGRLTSKQKPAAQPAAAEARVSPEEVQELTGLRQHWATLNNELLRYVNRPETKRAQELVDEQQKVNERINAIHRKLPGGDVGDVGVIGGGPSGLAAAINGPLEGIGVTVFEKGQVGGASRFTSRLENVTGGEAMGETGRTRANKNLFKALRSGATFERGHEITEAKYDPETQLWNVTTKGGQQFKYHALIANSGTQFREPTFQGKEMVHVGNGEAMMMEAKKGPVAVIGGANSAAQAALAAAEQGAKVTMIVRSPRVEMSDYQARQISTNPRIKAIYGDEVARIEPPKTKDGMKTVVTKKGERIPVKSIGAFIGGKARTDYLPDYVQKTDRGFVVTDASHRVLDKQNNPIPGLFAAGTVREGAVNRVLASEGEGQRAVTFAGKYIDDLRAGGKMPGWKAELHDAYNRAEWRPKAEEPTPTTVAPTERATTPSPTTKQPSLPGEMPKQKGVTPSTTPVTAPEPSTAPSGRKLPESSKSIAEGRRALMYGETGSEYFPDVSTGEKVVKPAAVTRDYAGGETTPFVPEARTPRAPPPPARVQADMAATVEKAYNDLHANRLIGEPNPARGLSKNEIIEGGRAAMREGVDPVAVSLSDKVRPDLKYGVMRAHAEDLRERSDALERQAKAKPTAENRSKAEDAFHQYSDWHRDTLAQKMAADGYLSSKGLEAITEEPDIQNMTDAREQFIRKHNRDWRPAERDFVQKKVNAVEKSTAARNAAMDDYGKRLREAVPHPPYDIKTPEELNGAVANILKRIFPCSGG